MDSALGKKLDDRKRASDRLQLISAHDALVLLGASCSTLKLMHIMHLSPYAGDLLLSDIYDSLRQIMLTSKTNEEVRLALPLKLKL